jgi:hypothetical protein
VILMDKVTLKQTQLKSSDILLLKPATVVEILKEEGVDSDEVPALQCQLAKKALASDAIVDVFVGLKEPASDFLKVLITVRLASSCGQLKPTIGGIADLSKISRNKVSPLVNFLEYCDLVNVKSLRREQQVFPTAAADMYIDIITGNLKEECSNLRKIINDIKSEKIASDSLTFLENLETAFRLSKSAYDPNTINYEILKDLHDTAMKILVEAKDGKIRIDDFEEFSETLMEISKIKEKAKKEGLKPVILERTDEEFGGARVFRVKK